MRTKRVAVMNSGGPDSACIMKYLHDRDYEVWSAFIDLGQDCVERAAIAAEQSAQRWAVEARELKFDFGVPPMMEMSELHKDRGIMHQAPFVIVVGAMFAYANNLDEVWYGSRPEGVFISGEAWLSSQEAFLNDNAHVDKMPLRVFPLGGMTKIQIMEWAGASIDDLTHTVTCNRSVPCGGVCRKCRGRLEAGIPLDPGSIEREEE